MTKDANIEVRTSTKPKRPPKDLAEVFAKAADALVTFADLWKQALEINQRAGYGYTDTELKEMFTPFLKKRLTRGQIKYLFDAEYYKAKSKEQYAKYKTANISQDDSTIVKEDEEIEYCYLTEKGLIPIHLPEGSTLNLPEGDEVNSFHRKDIPIDDMAKVLEDLFKKTKASKAQIIIGLSRPKQSKKKK